MVGRRANAPPISTESLVPLSDAHYCMDGGKLSPFALVVGAEIEPCQNLETVWPAVHFGWVI